MPKYRGTRAFKAALQVATVEGIQMAAERLTEQMTNLVSIQCGAVKGRTDAMDKQHAPEGQPPFLESGIGMLSIDCVPTKTGAQVGVGSMGIPNMVGANYMAQWDTPAGIRDKHHPWLSLFFKDKRYQKEMAQIVLRHLKQTTGAT